AFEDTLADITPRDVSVEPEHRIVHIRKKPYLEIELIPFRKASHKEVKWDKLLKFSVTVSYDKTSEKPEDSLKSGALKYTQTSRLADGKWVKIGTTERGVHKISYSKLEDWGFSEPSKVQVFGNGGSMVPMANNEERPDDIPPVGCLHSGDALFFYSPGPWEWTWDKGQNLLKQKKHKYSPTAFFFLSETDEEIREPDSAEPIEETNTHTTNTYDFLHFHEKDIENLLNSGNQWLGEKFNRSSGLERDFSLEIPGVVHGSRALLFTRVLGRSNSENGFEITINDEINKILNINTVVMSDYERYYARSAQDSLIFTPDGSGINISYSYFNDASTSVGWLDYFIINARAHLNLEHGQLVFRDRSIVGEENITDFQISEPGENTIVWDVSNPRQPIQLPAQKSGDQISFKDHSDHLKEYAVFDTGMSFPSPEFIENIDNQNLHDTQPAEMIIVVPSDFKSQAKKLASLHAQYSNLNVTVAERDKIYNEFSWGHPDPGAIRSFMKMLYDRAGDNHGETPELLLLFGDGTYDNRHIDNEPAAPLPTYQSDNSIYQTQTYVTDDFFGVLDDNEGKDLRNDRLDIGIGRFPVNTREQADNAVKKTELYLTGQKKDQWKTHLTFIGDDGDNSLHMKDADRLTRKIEKNQPQFDINKIYLDAYEVSSGSSGREFPGAKSDIQKAISEGTLIFNYTGHGSENNLAHERIVTKSDIKDWKNKDRLPLFVTATCEFSRFDNHNYTSAGEEVFLNPNGGGVALLSTTRIVYSSLNFTLNNAFYNHVFENDDKGRPLRLGEIMRRTKIEAGSNTNKLNFTLLGDPALRLNYPDNDVSTTSLNGRSVNEQEADTIRAMSKNTIQATVQDHEGNKLEDFNGTAYISLFDKSVEVQTLGNGGRDTFEYNEYANVLFKGESTITDGEFEFEFVVPRDIRYNFDNGRISYYAIAEDGREAIGASDQFVVGGISNNPIMDEEGPEINMYLNHQNFKPGGNTGPRPMLHADIFDESGINTSGIGIGHNITLIIDGDKNNPIVLNDAFSAATDDYQKGTLTFQLPEMKEGNHEITLKVWDNYNNSSTETLTFRVTGDHGVNIRAFNFWPNPVKRGEDVFFTMQTDIPNSVIDATFQFADASGRVTGVIKDELISSGNRIGPYKLPMDHSGWKHSGICFVRIILETQSGKKTSVVARLLPAP
ncbi:MAG: type IX secretion system sortase PorU, partial [Marinilabilia sp.]